MTMTAVQPTPFVPPLLSFFVDGIPVPQGSKRAWLNNNTGRVMMKEDQGTRHADWRYHVTAVARQAMADAGISDPARVALTFSATFYFARGIGHYGTGRNAERLKESAPAYPDKPPDLDKLVRAIWDALTDARVWVDDGQVVSALVRKRWADRFTERAGVKITVGVQP